MRRAGEPPALSNASLVRWPVPEMMKANALRTLAEMGEEYLNYDVIGIDEGQFFSDVRGCR